MVCYNLINGKQTDSGNNEGRESNFFNEYPGIKAENEFVVCTLTFCNEHSNRQRLPHTSCSFIYHLSMIQKCTIHN